MQTTHAVWQLNSSSGTVLHSVYFRQKKKKNTSNVDFQLPSSHCSSLGCQQYIIRQMWSR